MNFEWSTKEKMAGPGQKFDVFEEMIKDHEDAGPIETGEHTALDKTLELGWERQRGKISRNTGRDEALTSREDGASKVLTEDSLLEIGDGV